MRRPGAGRAPGRRSLTGPVVKSLIFVLVTAFATTVLAVSIAGAGVGDTYHYTAEFTDTTGLNSGDSVRIAGVKVGRVDSIHVVRHRVAAVRFSVRKSRTLPGSATATIKYLNMVGQRYIDLEQGTGPVGATLRPGATIPLTRTTPALDLTELFNGFQPLFEGLSPKDVNQLSGEIIQVLQGEGGTVDGLMSGISSLTTTLAAKDQVIGQVIDNLNSVLGTVNARETGLNDLITSLQQVVTGFSADREPIGQSITAISQLTTSTAGLLQDGRAPLKQSIDQLGRLSDNLAAGTPQLQAFLADTPAKMRDIGRLASYGSWLNLYLCQATVKGVTTSDGSTPPTGIAITAARCTS
ncbi:MCE family protein [Actinacidiphila yeochonensis]|uniref:MCE family protein n=1 Tax=Actinacidiphila yeochonensis TaxID=89050 RepID=UPI000562F5FC|nr:MCE family protein [Actinacidiphila yeochonensis]